MLAISATAAAQPARETPLYTDDLSQNKKTRIDAPTDSLDAQLDAALGGPQGFSTQELEKIEQRLRAELQRVHPRATPRLIVFLYPGKITVERLRSLSEVDVDLELVMDPCERSVCRDAVGKHIELVGRAVGAAALAEPGHKLVFKTLTLSTSTQMHSTEVMVWQVPIGDCIAASKKSGGGAAWLDQAARNEEQWGPIVTKAIARRAQEKRVQLAGVPSVHRAGDAVDVLLKVHGDRARVQPQVTDALAACALGLKDNPASPSTGQLEVDLETNQRGAELRKFRAPAQPVGLFVAGQLSSKDLWASYVEEVKKEKNATRLGFDDEGGGGGEGGGEGPAPDDAEAVAVLSANFSSVGGCARTEAARSSSFRGVTVAFTWQPSGSATDVHPKEAQLRGGALAKCLDGAVRALKLPRFSGPPRTIEYPIRVR